MPNNVSFNSKIGVSISQAPCYLYIYLIVSITLDLIIIYKGSVSLVPFGTFGLINSTCLGYKQILRLVFSS